MNALMQRRMRMQIVSGGEDVPIGVELFDYNAVDAEPNVYIAYYGADYIGKTEYTVMRNTGNYTTGWLPIDSRYTYSFTGNSGATTAAAIMADENHVIYAAAQAKNMAPNLQTYAQNAESQYGVKIKWVKISCTTANYNNRAISYKRTS